jgi:uncharacterized membrane protein YeaQ/YmgE (transglycosylase-associated protein family)
MSPEQWLQVIFLGGILGAAGQSARVIVGLKKVNDQADATNTDFSELIIPSRLLVSLLIGFVAGVLAAVAMQDDKPLANLSSAVLLGFAAAGYAGTDFIEGIMSRFLPSGGGDPAKNAGGSTAGNNATLYKG